MSWNGSSRKIPAPLARKKSVPRRRPPPPPPRLRTNSTSFAAGWIKRSRTSAGCVRSCRNSEQRFRASRLPAEVRPARVPALEPTTRAEVRMTRVADPTADRPTAAGVGIRPLPDDLLGRQHGLGVEFAITDAAIGTPVPGARVEIHQAEGGFYQDRDEREFALVSGSDG